VNSQNPSQLPLWQRILHRASEFALAIAGCIFLGLASLAFLAGHSPSALIEFFSPSYRLAAGICVVTIFVVLVFWLPAAVVTHGIRRGWLTWRVMAACWLAVGALALWLQWDDSSLLYPTSLEDNFSTFPGADMSYTTLMRYPKRPKGPEAIALSNVKWAVPSAGPAIYGDARRRFSFVAEKRAALAADWERLAPQREWLAELNRFDRIGDLAQMAVSDTISFNIWGLLSQRTCAQALGLALDGKGDEAIDVLIPMLEVGRKLQPFSLTLVRGMIGMTVEKSGLETAGMVLDRTPVSAAARSRLLAALGPDDSKAIARHLVLSDYPYFISQIRNFGVGDLATRDSTNPYVMRRVLNALGSLFINPKATANAYARQMLSLAAAAEDRDLPRLSRTAIDQEEGGPPMKNLVGWLMTMSYRPSLDYIMRNFWSMADLREALRARLKG
jgi:hypothetical protein